MGKINFNKLYIGLILGIVVPMILFVAYFFYRHHDSDLTLFNYIAAIHKYGLLFKVMSLCVLADLPLFYIFIRIKYWNTARGVVMACFIFALAVAGYKLFN
jgi:hypothetical protein